MNKKLRKFLLLPLFAAVMFACAQTSLFDSFAAENQEIARTNNPDGPGYKTVSALNTAIEKYAGNENFNIYMTADWGNERLVIPEGKKITLYMNGYMFNRGLARDNSWERNGENIVVRSGAILTINGGDRQKSHRVGVYTSRDSGNKANTDKTINGGVIAGGCSTNGAGGIHVEGDVTLNLNDVTIAGCRAEDPWYDAAGTNSGYGGGIWVRGGNVRLTMVNSTITGCHAQEDGGGIYESNYDNFRLVMRDSHVDNNYSRSDGGGINIDGEKSVVKGEGSSSVSGNSTDGIGGGIYLWNDESTVSGLAVNDNSARKGGGIYTQEETIILKDLSVSGNSAGGNGGGIYVENDNTTIDGCVIENNRNHGVYVCGEAGDAVDTGFNVNGNSVIRNNEDGNLTMHDGSTHVSFAPARYMDIHMGYVELPHHIENTNWHWEIAPDTSPDSRQFISSDNPDYLITYSYYESAYSGRRMCFTHKNHLTEMTGYPLEKVVRAELSVRDAAPKVVGETDAGGDKMHGGEFDLIRGILHREKTSSGVEDKDSVFYYTDGLFYGDPYVYNNHLATASWNLAFAGTYLREGAAQPSSYKYKHTGARQFLADIGCPDQNIYVNDYNIRKPGTDSIGVIIGSKELTYKGGRRTGDILIPVAVRGGGYEAEWASNVLLGSGTSRGGEAQGFSEAADEVMRNIEYYIAKYELEDELASGSVKFWVSGFSRAGATANITSKRLVEKYADGSAGKNNQVFSYPCEAPKGGTDNAQLLPDASYFCIHNLVNAADIVPLVGPEEMGFKRYGVDHYMPGSVTSEDRQTYTNNIKQTVKAIKRGGGAGVIISHAYCDNTRLKSKPEVYGDKSELYTEYVARRTKMVRNLASIDSTILFNDFFRPKGMKLSSFVFGQVGTYEGTYEEDFIEDFLSFLQASSITSRKAWAEDVTRINGKDYGTVQQAMRDSMALLFSMSDDSKAGTSERLASLSKILSFSNSFSLLKLYDDVLGDWHDLSEEDKEKYINLLWDYIVDTGALEFLPEGEASKLERNWPVMANMIFNFTDADWEATPGVKGYEFPSKKAWVKYDGTGEGNYMMYSFTLAGYIGQILRYHDPELNIAWTRTYDDYYDEGDDLKEYEVNWGNSRNGKGSYTSEAPSAYIKNVSDGGYTALVKNGSSSNELGGDRRIYLEAGRVGSAAGRNQNDVNGEAIFYKLTDVTGGEGSSAEVLESEQLYRGGIDLSLENADFRKFRIEAYSRSYGVNSSNSVYYVTLRGVRHNVNVIYGEPDSSDSYSYAEADTVTVTAAEIANKYFTGWTVADGNGRDVTSMILGSGPSGKAGSVSVEFKMPVSGAKIGSYTWAEDYSLTFTANYSDKIKKLTASGLSTPEAGAPLDALASVSFDNGASPVSDIPVVWTYQKDGQSVIQTGNAYRDTEYTAVLQISQDAAGGRLFASQDSLSAELAGASAKDIMVRRNDADGSVMLIFSFDKTGDEGEFSPEADIGLTIEAYDLNAGKVMTEVDPQWTDVRVLVHPGSSVVVSAPDVQDEVFGGWVIPEASGISITSGKPEDRTVTLGIPEALSSDELRIRANYVPVVNLVSADVKAPEAGKALPDTATLMVKITNSFEISPENVSVTWTPSPADGKAAHMTAYTATVGLRPDSEGKVRVRPAGSSGEYSGIADADYIIYSDTLSVKFNGKDATYDTAARTLSGTFDPLKYNLRAVRPVENISGLPNGSGASAVKAALPAFTKAVLDDGSEPDAAITWGTPQKTSASSDPLEASAWEVSGTIALPENTENRDGVSLNVKVTVYVNEAPAASSPRASLESGRYLANQMVTLSTSTEGGTILYTTDGSSPSSSSTAKTYGGETIYIERENNPDGLTLRAVTRKSGMRESTESVYKYEFSNEVPVPQGQDLVVKQKEAADGTVVRIPQTGVSAGAFYKLEVYEPADDGDNFVIDEKTGDAVAKEAGVYKVKAVLNKGFVWAGSSGSSEPEIISFRIFSNADELAAQKVIDLINAIPSPAKASDEEQVKEARMAYDGLTDVQKKLVPDEIYGKLLKAEKDIENARKSAELDLAKKKASAELDAVRLSAYIEPERGIVSRAVSGGRSAISRATDIAGINAALAAAKKTISAQALYDPKLPKVTNKKPARAKKALKAKWKKLSKKKRKKVKGFEVMTASNKKFTANVKTGTAGRGKSSKKIRRLKSKKTYYVKVRSYVIRNGVRYVGKWSKAKKVKTR